MNNREKGIVGENIACRHLIRLGYTIVSRNYLKKWGEIDIVATKGGIHHFFEIKSTFYAAAFSNANNTLRPEENVHRAKILRLRRVIRSYLAEIEHNILQNMLQKNHRLGNGRNQGYSVESSFCFHVMTLRIDLTKKKVKIAIIPNIII